MGLLKHFRSRSKLSSHPVAATYHAPSHDAAARGRDYSSILPENVLDTIFAYVCPHVLDRTYLPCEESQIGDGCPLCDLRDLARCAQLCRRWYAVAQRLLYTSVRIDAVHYCALEEVLGERRKRGRSARGRKKAKEMGWVAEAGDVPTVRLALLCRTVREVGRLAEQVLLLKLPYMTRETAKGDVARTVSALPNLQYVDLPDGFFTGEPSCLALRQELQAQCPDIRKMSYRAGSEDALELLAHRHWQSIQILELSGLAIEPATLRIVLGSLPILHELTLADMSWVDDTIFQSSRGRLPDFPPLQALKLENMPNITAIGIGDFLNAPQNREILSTLSLSGTGVAVHDLHRILGCATNLRNLAILDTVSKSLSLAASSQSPPLSSLSLKTLHFEITSSEEAHGLQKPAESYYAYLATSLQQNALPSLTTLYVRDPQFPELLITPLVPPFSSDSNSSLRSKPSNLSSSTSSHRGPTSPSPTIQPPTHDINDIPFHQTLEIFSKGIDELEWVFTSFHPTTTSSPDQPHASPLSGGRPLSAYSASRGLGPQWAHGGFGGEARKSVIVGNGFGGFLAVPQEEVPRPMTPDGGRGSVVSVGGSPGRQVVDGVGGSRWGSVGTDGRGGGSGFLRPPPSMSSLTGSEGSGQGQNVKRGSRHDLWR
ncbi:F-box domain protein [Teratosphaeria destructans]|uniref:F-box domain protein n=1 Tax=Teratosphaeria destructans TaxID=418781 RepID=A0A9W7SPI0_9PEZI|nr:F-box domain protein [Teratosphaeria destructans]